MKKFIYLFLIVLIGSSVLAATYKINKNGTIKAPNGTATQIKTPQTTNYFNNYYSQNYVNSQVVNKSNVNYIEIVMDFSGSMTSWVNVAKNTMTQILSQIPASTNVGFRVFGQNQNGQNPQTLAKVLSVAKKQTKNGTIYNVKTENCDNVVGPCAATSQIAKIMPANATNLISAMNSVSLGGATPLTLALKRAAYDDFAGISTSFPKKIVLITDGGENCGGDPCAFAKELMRQRNDIHVDVVLVSSSSRQLTCLSSTTGGNFYTTNDLSNFSDTLIRSMTTQPNQTQQKQNYEFIND